MAHLKGRLVKERGIVDARRKTVSCFIYDPPRRHSVRRYVVIVAYSLVLAHAHGLRELSSVRSPTARLLDNWDAWPTFSCFYNYHRARRHPD